MAAFRKAAKLGADAIELDAKLTADGVVVVLHDQTLDRTTTGHGKLRHHTLGEISKLDAGRFFSEEFAGERIPTLEEVFLELGEILLINVELTNYGSPLDELPRKVISLVKDHGLERRVLFSSFNPIALAKARKFAPEIPLGLLLLPQEPRWIRGLLRALTPYEALHPEKRLVTKELIDRERAKGKAVNVWTVNEISRLSEMIAIGVDGLITDVPDVARMIYRDEEYSRN
ncbi:MAG TPA: glycerophosphodiester phosphodiesterase [Anaerolineae bacterium]|nr:glycerophosphodiester phosphodiesterase [Anaerolineae bacterium]